MGQDHRSLVSALTQFVPAILRSKIGGLLLLLATAGAALPISAGAAPNLASLPASDARELADAVTAVRSISTLRADFEQIDANGQTVSGVLTLKQPGKLRFQYQPGYPVLIVSDGHALVMIDYEVRQVRRFPLRFTPIGALLDPRRDVSRIVHLRQSADPNSVSVLIHDRGLRENGDMTIFFVRNRAAPGGLEISGWETIDAQNQRTIVRLSHQRYDVDVSDDMFKWLDPRKPAQRAK